MLYVYGDIRSRIIKCEHLLSAFESLVIELSFNLLLICYYNPLKKYKGSYDHIWVLSSYIDQSTQKYENVILMGDIIFCGKLWEKKQNVSKIRQNLLVLT